MKKLKTFFLRRQRTVHLKKLISLPRSYVEHTMSAYLKSSKDAWTWEISRMPKCATSILKCLEILIPELCCSQPCICAIGAEEYRPSTFVILLNCSNLAV